MPELFVVYDTNVYRELGWPEFEEVKRMERQHSIRGLSNYFVATELLAHLANQSDPSLAPSVSALRRMWSHTTRYDGSVDVLTWTADSEAQVINLLFGLKPGNRGTDSLLLGSVLQEVTTTHSSKLSGHANEVIKYVDQHIRDTEQLFVDDLFTNIVLRTNPNAKNWDDARQPGSLRDALLEDINTGRTRDRVALALTAKAARDAGVPLDQTLHASKSEILSQRFPTPICVYDLLISRILTDGVDMSRYPNQNSIWDLQIAYSTGVGANIQDAPVWLITSDPLILKASKIAGTSNSIWQTADYLNLLKDDWRLVRDRIRLTA